MKIFLKILGFIFTLLITALVSVTFFVLFCSSNVNAAIQLLSEKSTDTLVAVMMSIGLGIFFSFCPIWFEINNKINDLIL